MKKSLDILLLDRSLEFYCILDSSVKPALLKAIASQLHSAHKGKCILWACLQSMFHLYVHTLWNNFPSNITVYRYFQITFFQQSIQQITILFSKKHFSERFMKIDPTSVKQHQTNF